MLVIQIAKIGELLTTVKLLPCLLHSPLTYIFATDELTSVSA